MEWGRNLERGNRKERGIAHYLEVETRTVVYHYHIYRVSLSILSAQRTREIPWTDREPRVFFRGRDSNKARLELVKRHRKNTELFDVGITNWFFFTHDEEVYGPKMKAVSFHDFFKVS